MTALSPTAIADTTERPAPSVLPPLAVQAERLIALGLATGTGAGPDALRAAADQLATHAPEGALLVIHEDLAPPSVLAPNLSLPAPGRAGAGGERRAGFVVVDMADVDRFRPTPDAEIPHAEVYYVTDPRRGDELRNTTPGEASLALAAAGRTPLTLTEGMHWALQQPDIIEPNACFMTIGSRAVRPDGAFDARTPALWISRGTGRDGRERAGAPKVGWCWWGNRHAWLGFASAASRASALTSSA